MKRLPVALGVLTLAVSVLSPLGGLNSARALVTSGPWCSNDVNVAPCVVTAMRIPAHGSPEMVNVDSDDYQVQIELCSSMPDPDGSCDGLLNWQLEAPGAHPLSASDGWQIIFNVGTIAIDQAQSGGADVTEVRRVSNGENQVVVTGHPQHDQDATQCFAAGDDIQCGESDDSPTSAISFAGSMGHNSSLSAAENTAERGLDSWSNAALFYNPTVAASSLSAVLAGNYKTSTGTVAENRYHLLIPAKLLRRFGIDAPMTLVARSLTARIPSGHIVVSRSGTSAAISISGIVFPDPTGTGTVTTRLFTVHRGVITPVAPTHLRIVHRGGKKTTVKVGGAHGRGAKITKYVVDCSARGAASRLGAGKTAKVKVQKLAAGRTYHCKARLLSTAGAGPWSASIKLS
jgi:hypothetical protein